MNSSQPEAVLTIREVSEYLRLAESTVYKLAQKGKLPGRKIGGAWRFPKKNLDDWLQQQMPEKVAQQTQFE